LQNILLDLRWTSVEEVAKIRGGPPPPTSLPDRLMALFGRDGIFSDSDVREGVLAVAAKTATVYSAFNFFPAKFDTFPPFIQTFFFCDLMTLHRKTVNKQQTELTTHQNGKT
jgi:hypothetical protein